MRKPTARDEAKYWQGLALAARDAVDRVRALPRANQDWPYTHDEQWARGYNAALDDMRRALAGALGEGPAHD